MRSAALYAGLLLFKLAMGYRLAAYCQRRSVAPTRSSSLHAHKKYLAFSTSQADLDDDKPAEGPLAQPVPLRQSQSLDSIVPLGDKAS